MPKSKSEKIIKSMLKSMREKKRKEKKRKIAHIFKTKAKEREHDKGVQIKSLKAHTLALLDQSV